MKRFTRDSTIRGKMGGNVMEFDMYGNLIGNTRPWMPLVNKRGDTEAKVETKFRDRSEIHVEQRL